MAPPLLADVEGDGKQEIVVLIFHRDLNHYFHPPPEGVLRLAILNENLSVLREYRFPAPGTLNNKIGQTVVADFDADGFYEIAVATPDSVLHVLEAGNGMGDAEWHTAYGNNMHTNIASQTVRGSYTASVSLFNRANVVGDVTFESDLYVDAGADVRVEPSDSEASGSDTTKCELVVQGVLNVVGSTENRVTLGPAVDLGDSLTWVGVVIDSSGAQSILRHANVYNAETPLTANDSLAVVSSQFVNCLNAVVSRRHFTADELTYLSQHDNGEAIYIQEGAAHISQSSITMSGGGGVGVLVDSMASEALIETSTVETTSHGVLSRAPMRITGCSVSGGGGVTWGVEGFDSVFVLGSDVNGGTGLSSSRYLNVAQSSVSGDFVGVRISGGSAVLSADTVTVNSSGTGVIVGECDSVSIASTVINAGYYGVKSESVASPLSLLTTTIRNAEFAGALLSASGPAEIFGCTFSDNDIGLDVHQNSDVTVDSCYFDSNDTDGMFFRGNSDCVVARTTVSNSVVGVYCLGGSDVAIEDQNIIESNTVGVKCADYSHATIRVNYIRDNQDGVAAVDGSDPNLGAACGASCVEPCPGMGNNSITGNSGFHVSNLSPGVSISAECNYWGARGPRPTKFYGAVDYSPHLTSTPPPLATIARETAEARRFHLYQNHPEPVQPFDHNSVRGQEADCRPHRCLQRARATC